MSFINIFFHAIGDNIGMLLQKVGILRPHFCSYFIGNMDQLPEARIIIRMVRYMALCIYKFTACPIIYLVDRR